MQVFEIYLSDFENQSILYNQIQRVIYLFIKLKSKLRAILINYQNLSIIKKRLLILTCRLKNNMKKTIKVQTTFDNCLNSFKSNNNKKKK